MGRSKQPATTKTILIKGRYMDSTVIEKYFGQIFGHGKATVRWKRGQYQCEIPDDLTQNQYEALQAKIEENHYEEE